MRRSSTNNFMRFCPKYFLSFASLSSYQLLLLFTLSLMTAFNLCFLLSFTLRYQKCKINFFISMVSLSLITDTERMRAVNFNQLLSNCINASCIKGDDDDGGDKELGEVRS